ncbi:MAG: insulinase family protein [Candidatus Rokubacteria bacterium]|nr:insulinase family protein [Candidatus Rokubacteria bacterium]
MSPWRAGLLVLALGGALGAPVEAAPAFQRERLPNGMTVLVRENPTAPVVAVSLLVRMGARWERSENAGISNFAHALMVKGTTRRSGAELAELIAGFGGKLSASGDVDYSGIRATALARFWREVLGLTAELALQPKLAADEVDGERDWLLSRIQRRVDNPVSRAFDEFYAALYGAHPYGLPALGSRESLARIDHAALVAYYRAFYRPERMTLAVSGQVAAAEVFAEARRLFGGMPGGGASADPPIPPPAPAARRLVIEQPAQQAQILVGGIAPAIDHPDHAAVRVLATILGGGMAGRLFVELRDKTGLAYTASAFYDPVREPGALVLYLGTSPGNADRAEEALAREVQKIRTEPVSAEELNRAKGYLLGKYAMDRRTNDRQAWYLTFYEVEGVGGDFPDRYRRAAEAVTSADVLRVARTYLATLTTLVLRPPRSR